MGGVDLAVALMRQDQRGAAGAGDGQDDACAAKRHFYFRAVRQMSDRSPATRFASQAAVCARETGGQFRKCGPKS